MLIADMNSQYEVSCRLDSKKCDIQHKILKWKMDIEGSVINNELI